jgi:murein DD-endopeptidase MepM/ murein hydrolase activator NlpD
MDCEHWRPKRRREPCQVIIAKGDDVKVFQLRGWMIVLAATLAAGVTFWIAASTAYIFFRDDVLAAMMSRQTRMQHAYEDRIAALRLQIDRITSRQLLDQEAFHGRVEDLIRRQTTIDGRSQAVQALIDRAQRTGTIPVPPPVAPRADANVDSIVTGSIAGAARADIQRGSRRLDVVLDAVETSLNRLVRAQDQALAKIETTVREQESRIRNAVADLGIEANRIAGPRPRPRTATSVSAREPGIGGPLIPLPTAQASALHAFDLRTAYLQDQLAYLDRLQRGLSVLPIRRPMRGEPEVSSGFGPRRDPFLGIMAFHAGIDFRGSIGDPVAATAAGTVTQAGRNGGFGIMVEINHGHGLFTRYAHLSALNVREGQTVTAGQIVGRVGSTGRSTGPHLHYETWVENEAVNPERFMRAGQRLGLW